MDDHITDQTIKSEYSVIGGYLPVSQQFLDEVTRTGGVSLMLGGWDDDDKLDDEPTERTDVPITSHDYTSTEEP